MRANGGARGRTKLPKYANGGSSALMRRPEGARENLEQNGEWTHAQLLRMDAQFCARLERAIARGLEHMPE